VIRLLDLTVKDILVCTLLCTTYRVHWRYLLFTRILTLLLLSTCMINLAFHPSWVGKWIVIHGLWGWRPLNGRPGLHMAVRRKPRSHGSGISLQPIGCALTLSVTYSAAAAANRATCGAIQVLCLYLLALVECVVCWQLFPGGDAARQHWGHIRHAEAVCPHLEECRWSWSSCPLHSGVGQLHCWGQFVDSVVVTFFYAADNSKKINS